MRRTHEISYLTTRDVSATLGVSAMKVAAWIESGELKAFDIASGKGIKPRWRINERDFEKFLRKLERNQGAGRKQNAKLERGPILIEPPTDEPEVREPDTRAGCSDAYFVE